MCNNGNTSPESGYTPKDCTIVIVAPVLECCPAQAPTRMLELKLILFSTLDLRQLLG